MSIRTKLIVIIALIIAVLGGVTCIKLYDFSMLRKRMQLVLPAVNYLQGIADTDAAVTRQRKEIIDYLLTANEDAKSEFASSANAAGKGLQLWQSSVKAQLALETSGEEGDLDRALVVEKGYRAWSGEAEKLLGQGRSYPRQEALELQKKLEDSGMYKEVVPAIDASLADAVNEVQTAFNNTILSTATLPWLNKETHLYAEKTRLSLENLILLNRLNSSLNKLTKELMDFVLSGQERHFQKFAGYAEETERIVGILIDNVEKKSPLDENDDGKDFKQIIFLASESRKALALARHGADLVMAGDRKQAARIAKDELEQELTARIFPQLAEALQEGHGEIKHHFAQLYSITSSAIWKGVMFILVFGVSIVAIAWWLIYDMLASLNKLQTGLESFGSGDFSCRLNMSGTDEFGRLAASFDNMAGQLQVSHDEIASLNERLGNQVLNLESANRELEAFGYMVSHDLRRPLTSIIGYTQILLEDSAADPGEKAKAYLQRIDGSCKQMNQLISDMLRLSRITRTTLQRRHLDAAEPALQIVNELRFREPERDVEFRIIGDLSTSADPALLQMLLVNLIGNAWKYTRPNSFAVIEFGASEEEGSKIFFVRDNGVGFDMKHADQLFTAFGRLHTDKQFEGNGVGLVIVKRIVERHDGMIWAEADVGKGATFYFTLGTFAEETV